MYTRRWMHRALRATTLCALAIGGAATADAQAGSQSWRAALMQAGHSRVARRPEKTVDNLRERLTDAQIASALRRGDENPRELTKRQRCVLELARMDRVARATEQCPSEGLVRPYLVERETGWTIRRWEKANLDAQDTLAVLARMAPVKDSLAALSRTASPDSSARAQEIKVMADSLRVLECRLTLRHNVEFIQTRRKSSCMSATGIAVASIVTLSASSNTGSAFVDLLSTNFGVARVSVASAIASNGKKADSTAAAEGSQLSGDTLSNIQRLIMGGGSISFRGEWPALNGTFGQTLFLTGALTGRLALDAPALGAQVNNATTNNGVGGELRVLLFSDDKKLGLVTQTRFERVSGSADFYQNIGLQRGHGPIQYGQLSIGAAILQQFVVTWSRVFYAPHNTLRMFDNQVGVSAYPFGR